MGLLYTQEEMANSKLYTLMSLTKISIPFKKEEPHQRYPMTMDIQDHAHQKDSINFHHLATEIVKCWKRMEVNPATKFPEEDFRSRFGSHKPQPSWYHVAETMKFQICEFAPNQLVPDSSEFYTEFIRFWSKKQGWFKYINGQHEFVPSDDQNSWVREMRPKDYWTGEKIYYNAEVSPNTPEWFNYNKPLEMNPQTGVIANDMPLYVLGRI